MTSQTGSFLSQSGAPLARAIGIDLGTTNTCAAFADGRIPRIIPTEKGHHLLSSVVAFVNDRVLVGQPAKEQLVIHPEETVYGSKRLVGRAYHSAQTQRLRRRFAYRVVEGDRGRCAVDVGGKVRSLTDISTILLEQITRYALTELKENALEGVVISVPAYYPLSQRAAVKQAAEAAGLDVWRLVNEPTAAALAYGVGRRAEQRVLVFDLGGGTFDVSILDIAGGTYQVLGTGGDGFLGGVDFDIRVAEHLIERFEEETGARIGDDVTVMQRVLGAAEVAKQDLSLLQHVDVMLPFLAEKRGKPLDLQTRLSRPDLERLTRDLVERCVRLAEQVLEEAGLGPGDIDEVLLAGGQTRMPLLQAEIEKRLGRAPKKGVHPDEVVAQGSALLARSLAGSDSLRLLDVLSVPLGVGRRRPDGSVRVETVIGKNTTLPHEETVTLDTWLTDQTAMEIDLFQGRSEDPLECEYLGTVVYDALPLGPAGSRSVYLSVHVDAEGLPTFRAHHGNPRAARQLHLVGRAPDYLDVFVEAPPTIVEGKERGLLRRLLRR